MISFSSSIFWDSVEIDEDFLVDLEAILISGFNQLLEMVEIALKLCSQRNCDSAILF